MSNGANSIHKQLRSELEDYIKAQYFGRSPLLLSAVEDRLDDEGLLYESSANGIQGLKLPDWQKSFFLQLSKAGLGVHPTPFVHQTDALQAAADGRDVFVSTGTGSGKTTFLNALSDFIPILPRHGRYGACGRSSCIP